MWPQLPTIFRQITQYTTTGRYDQPTDLDRYRMIRTYFEMLITSETPEASGKMKQFASWFTHGVPGGAALRKSIYESKTGEAVLAAVERFFEAGPIRTDPSAPVSYDTETYDTDALALACD